MRKTIVIMLMVLGVVSTVAAQNTVTVLMMEPEQQSDFDLLLENNGVEAPVNLGRTYSITADGVEVESVIVTGEVIYHDSEFESIYGDYTSEDTVEQRPRDELETVTADELFGPYD